MMSLPIAAFLSLASLSVATEPVPSSRPDATATEPADVEASALRDELLSRRAEDQAARAAIMEAVQASEDGELGVQGLALVMRVKQVDARNRAWLKGVVDEHGWPGRSLVGNEAAEAAWLLVQHADDDVAFQERVLPLLQAAVERGDAEPRHAALLLDRVRVNRGRPQVYGTQTRRTAAGVEPLPIEDAEQVDERRAAVGLQPLAEYLKVVAEATSPATRPSL